MVDQTLEYQLRSSSVDVMTEILEIENLEEYLYKRFDIFSEEDNIVFSRFFYNHAVKMMMECVLTEGAFDPIDSIRSAMITGFLFGAQYQKRFYD